MRTKPGVQRKKQKRVTAVTPTSVSVTVWLGTGLGVSFTVRALRGYFTSQFACSCSLHVPAASVALISEYS